MAVGKSGSLIFHGSNNSIRLNWAEDYDANANTSVVRITSAELQSGTYYGTWYFNGNFSVNGSAVVYMSADSPATHVANVSAPGSTWYAIQTASGTAPPWYSGTLYHNADGTLTIPISIDMWSVRFSPNNVRSDFSGTQYVGLTTIPQPRTVTFSADSHSSITVTKNGVALTSGATVTHGDTINITYSANAGYAINSATLNDSPIASGINYIVESNVNIVITSKAMGLVYISNGSTLEPYQIFYDDGTQWNQCLPYLDNGDTWSMIS